MIAVVAKQRVLWRFFGYGCGVVAVAAKQRVLWRFFGCRWDVNGVFVLDIHHRGLVKGAPIASVVGGFSEWWVAAAHHPNVRTTIIQMVHYNPYRDYNADSIFN